MKQQIALALTLAMVLLLAAFVLLTTMIFTFIPFTQAQRLNMHIYENVDCIPAQSTSATIFGEDTLRMDITYRE